MINNPWPVVAAVYVVGLAIGALWWGRFENDEDAGPVIVVFWPLWLGCFVAAAPFVGLYRLGRWLRLRAEAKGAES